MKKAAFRALVIVIAVFAIPWWIVSGALDGIQDYLDEFEDRFRDVWERIDRL